jgi:hypothetical protein
VNGPVPLATVLKLAALPGHTLVKLTSGVAVVFVFTVTVPLPAPEQPVTPSVTVTVYVVVASGDAMMLAVVSPPGLHRNIGLAALCVAVSVMPALPGWQIVPEFTLTTGLGLTVSIALALAVLTSLVTVTEYTPA